MSDCLVSAEELKRRLDSGAIQFILDLRNEDEYTAWRIETQPDVPSINIPQEDYMGEEEKYLPRLPKNRSLAIICAHGDGSRYAAEMLRDWGYDAVSLKGGMDLWSDFYETHQVSRNPVIFQIYRVARGCLTHVIISDGTAAVIDPIRHTDRILALVSEHKAVITNVFDTHLHADHISGGPELAQKTGAVYRLHPADAPGAAVNYKPLQDGETIHVGASRLTVIHTPGHTPGSTSFLLDETYLFSGDAIMKNSIGRPDLGGKADEWTRMLFDTLFQRMSRLSDKMTLLPGHASSISEQDTAGIVKTSLQQVRAMQPLYRLHEFPQFLAAVRADLPENPERYQEIRKVNLGMISPDEQKLKELEIGKNLCGMVGKPS